MLRHFRSRFENDNFIDNKKTKKTIILQLKERKERVWTV